MNWIKNWVGESDLRKKIVAGIAILAGFLILREILIVSIVHEIRDSIGGINGWIAEEQKKVDEQFKAVAEGQKKIQEEMNQGEKKLAQERQSVLDKRDSFMKEFSEGADRVQNNVNRAFFMSDEKQLYAEVMTIKLLSSRLDRKYPNDPDIKKIFGELSYAIKLMNLRSDNDPDLNYIADAYSKMEEGERHGIIQDIR